MLFFNFSSFLLEKENGDVKDATKYPFFSSFVFLRNAPHKIIRLTSRALWDTEKKVSTIKKRFIR